MKTVFTKLKPNILLVPGFNPGPLTLAGTNTYIIGATKQRMLIDTGEASNPTYL